MRTIVRHGLLAVAVSSVSSLIALAPASAATVAVQGTYTVSYKSAHGYSPTFSEPNVADGYADVGTFNNNAGAFTLNLNPGTSSPTYDFFTINPHNNSCGNDCPYSNGGHIASGTVTVTFAFTEPSGATGTLTETGLYQAKYGGAPLSCTSSPAGDTDCINWSDTNDPIDVTFSNGDKLQITLNDAQDWDITPTLSFLLTTSSSNPPPTTPLPGALPLFASGSAVLGLLGWRRKRKAA